MTKKFSLILSLLITSFCISYAQQGPGGLNANLTVWLKANTGVTTAAPSASVTVWGEQSGANITGDFSTQGANINMSNTHPPTYVPLGINFNPQVTFVNSDTNCISSNNSFGGLQMMDPYNNTLIQVIYLHPTAAYTGVFFKWQYLNTNNERFGCETNPGPGTTNKMRCDFRGLTNRSNTLITTGYFLTDNYVNQTNSTIRLNGATDAVMPFNGLGAFAPTSNARLTLGNEEYGDAYPTTIDVAEVIFFKDTLSALQRNQVESYLAVKYGFTLDQTPTYANNYTSANGSLIWNHYDNIAYDNNITGIGRDDSSQLMQLQSKSINAAGIVTVFNGVYNGTNFPVLNTDNTNTFPVNNSFLLFGDNALDTSLATCYAGFLGMDRVWKFAETGTINTVTLAVPTTAVPSGVQRLLVSTTPNFTPATTVSYPLTNAGGYWSASIALPDSGYFTYASDSLVAHATSNSPVCAGSTIQLTGTIGTNAGYQWSGPNGFTSTVQNPTITNASAADSGAYILNSSSGACPVYPDTIVVIVHPLPNVPIVTTPVAYCQNDQSSALTATGQNLLWYTNPPTGAGSTTAPTPNTSIAGTTTWYVSQTINGCQSDSTAITVNVTTKPDVGISASGSSICQFDTLSFSYTGTAPSTDVYNWVLPASATLISGSGQGPLVVMFNTPGTYQVHLTVANGPCVSPDSFVTVTVTQAPSAAISLGTNVCVGQIDSIAVSSATSNINTFNWNFDGGTVLSGTNEGPYQVEWNNAGNHIVTLQFLVGACPSQLVVDTVSVNPYPTLQLTASAGDVCMGDSVQLTASADIPVLGYLWTPVGEFTDNDKSLVYAKVTEPGYVTVRVVSIQGCFTTDSIMLNAHPCCDIEVPSAFSPNGDGRNDIFRVVDSRPQIILEFRIMNRWGQTVFEATDNHGWDGTFNGTPQDIGVYTYYIVYACTDGRNYEKKGTITLVR